MLCNVESAESLAAIVIPAFFRGSKKGEELHKEAQNREKHKLNS